MRVMSACAAAAGIFSVLWGSAWAQEPTPLLPPVTQGPTNVSTSPYGASLAASPFPTLPVAEAAPAASYLQVARAAVNGGRRRDAEEALERAETRLLGGPPSPRQAALPGSEDALFDIGVAREALSAHDRVGTLHAIDDAMGALAIPSQNPAQATRVAVVPPAAQAAPPAPVVPIATYALLPGHWARSGASWKWIPPDTVLRRVPPSTLIPGQDVWQNGAYVWVPQHLSYQ
jgi:hypothetical protein